MDVVGNVSDLDQTHALMMNTSSAHVKQETRLRAEPLGKQMRSRSSLLALAHEKPPPTPHLLAFAAAEGGLFAAQGIEVEFGECVPARDRSLRGYGTTLKALAGNEADFALSSVAYLLAANTEAREPIGAWFAAVFHQRNHIAGMVAMDSGLREPSDRPGRKAAGRPGSWYTQEYAGALAHMGLGSPAIVNASQDLHAALRDGEIDVIPAWVDTTPAFSKCGPIRSIPLAVEVYATGLAAADRLPFELVVRTRDALVAGYRRHAQPVRLPARVPPGAPGLRVGVLTGVTVPSPRRVLRVQR